MEEPLHNKDAIYDVGELHKRRLNGIKQVEKLEERDADSCWRLLSGHDHITILLEITM